MSHRKYLRLSVAALDRHILADVQIALLNRHRARIGTQAATATATARSSTTTGGTGGTTASEGTAVLVRPTRSRPERSLRALLPVGAGRQVRDVVELEVEQP